jgi:hypothetical protein
MVSRRMLKLWDERNKAKLQLSKNVREINGVNMNNVRSEVSIHLEQTKEISETYN